MTTPTEPGPLARYARIANGHNESDEMGFRLIERASLLDCNRQQRARIDALESQLALRDALIKSLEYELTAARAHKLPSHTE